jgi:hypothetical protein
LLAFCEVCGGVLFLVLSLLGGSRTSGSVCPLQALLVLNAQLPSIQAKRFVLPDLPQGAAISGLPPTVHSFWTLELQYGSGAAESGTL